MIKRVAVIGGGIAGMEAAGLLASRGYDVLLVEKEQDLGGNVAKWDRLFPSKTPASDIVNKIKLGLSPSIKVLTNRTVTRMIRNNDNFALLLSDETLEKVDAILVTTGFQVFDALRKEEYGYGIYDNVITSVDLERMFASKKVLCKNGKEPKCVAFIHCVGSRDEKVNNHYCSRVCCITAVKQAIEMKELYPTADVYCFYMDLRMFGRYYEDFYHDAQAKYSVSFVRGRLSEAGETHDNKIVLKAEDTLIGKPLKVTVDMLVLMTGMESPDTTENLSACLELEQGNDRFITPADPYIHNNCTHRRGIFVAGACTAPKNIPETLADARSAVVAIEDYLFTYTD
ncbi:MAG: FAD-dependent oxidoreductase [Prevotellaceae bacterium]|jgi:heterodisulfide reductase subunit A|nr:FAD-dependent oxidoreductase [Prevotellaceae bacterium]